MRLAECLDLACIVCGRPVFIDLDQCAPVHADGHAYAEDDHCGRPGA